MKHFHLLFTLMFTLLISFSTITSVSANELKNHSSPYLALHGSDPVNWMEWGKPALDKAKKENKLLFVSIGYFACHWCHVMQRESFANEEIAKKLNKNYISVKIDRELNPVLDKRLIEFVQTTNGTAGWPLSVFVTPDGYPLVGATYLPRESFANVLEKLAAKWKSEQSSLISQAKETSDTITKLLQKQELSGHGKSMQQLANSFTKTAMQYATTLQGGFGQQQKFPQIPQLWALLKLNKQTKNKSVDEFIKLTLKQMAQKGLHDELGGGFYRYTTDPDWETPHFEKMLYTNAMMPLLYFDASEYFKEDKELSKTYKEVALETLYFLQDSMKGDKNAFITSLSAVDNKNQEGGFYLWTQDELKKLLNQYELKLANLYWNMERANELPAGNLPRQNMNIAELSKKLNHSPQAIRKPLDLVKNKLKLHREKTRKLPRDTKLLSGMNGLVLAAFAKGIKDDPSLKTSGDQLANFLSSLWIKDNKEQPFLLRSSANKKPGTLYDYAAVSWGLLKWAKATGSIQAKKTGNVIAQSAWIKFHIQKSWVENPDSLLPKGVQQTHLPDSALISAETLLLEASFLSDNAKMISKAQKVLNKVTRSLETDVYSFASLLALYSDITHKKSR